MDNNSAKSLDDFTVKFYQKCWNIIKKHLFEAVINFMKGTPYPKSFMSCTILPIQKKKDPQV